MNINPIDRDAVLSGNLGEEIMNIGTTNQNQLSMINKSKIPSVLSYKGAINSIGSSQSTVAADVILENPSHFMLT